MRNWESCVFCAFLWQSPAPLGASLSAVLAIFARFLSRTQARPRRSKDT